MYYFGNSTIPDEIDPSDYPTLIGLPYVPVHRDMSPVHDFGPGRPTIDPIQKSRLCVANNYFYKNYIICILKP